MKGNYRFALAGSLFFAGAAIVMACSDSDDGALVASGDGGAGVNDTDAAEAGLVHQSPDGGRPVAIACPTHVPSASQMIPADAGGACARDSDCDGGVGGRCALVRTRFDDPAPHFATCAYDRCAQDSDCTGLHGVCGCSVSSFATNVCLSNSNCRIDSDCAAGQRCALSDPEKDIAFAMPLIVTGTETAHDTGTEIIYEVGYFCTTPNDHCAPSDLENGSGPPSCVFNQDTQSWDWVKIGP